jgi:hypothetical protein
MSGSFLIGSFIWPPGKNVDKCENFQTVHSVRLGGNWVVSRSRAGAGALAVSLAASGYCRIGRGTEAPGASGLRALFARVGMDFQAKTVGHHRITQCNGCDTLVVRKGYVSIRVHKKPRHPER